MKRADFTCGWDQPVTEFTASVSWPSWLVLLPANSSLLFSGEMSPTGTGPLLRWDTHLSPSGLRICSKISQCSSSPSLPSISCTQPWPTLGRAKCSEIVCWLNISSWAKQWTRMTQVLNSIPPGPSTCLRTQSQRKGLVLLGGLVRLFELYVQSSLANSWTWSLYP